MSEITCYACDKEAVMLFTEGYEDRPVCKEHAKKLKEVGPW